MLPDICVLSLFPFARCFNPIRHEISWTCLDPCTPQRFLHLLNSIIHAHTLSVLLVLQPDASLPWALGELQVIQAPSTLATALISAVATPTTALERLWDHRLVHICAVQFSSQGSHLTLRSSFAETSFFFPSTFSHSLFSLPSYSRNTKPGSAVLGFALSMGLA